MQTPTLDYDTAPTQSPDMVLSGKALGLRYDGTNESATWEAIVDRVIALQAAGFTTIAVQIEGVITLGTDLGVVDGFAHALATYTGNMLLEGMTSSAGFKAANGVVAVAQTRVLVNRKCGNSGGATGDKHVKFNRITVDGNAFNQTVNTHGMSARFATDIEWNWCTFKNTYGLDTSTNETFAVDFLQSWHGRWFGCRVFSDDGGHMASGFSANNSTDVSWTGNWAYNCVHGQGMTSAYCTGVAIIGNIAYGNGANGINLEHHTEGSVTVANNVCGVKTLSGLNANNPLASSTAMPNAVHGINILSCQHVSITGNVCEYNTQNGINVAYDGSVNAFDLTGGGNVCRANVQDGVYVSHGYDVDLGVRSQANGRYGFYNDTPSTNGSVRFYGSAIGNTSFGVNQIGSGNAPYTDIIDLEISANNGGSGNNQVQMGAGGTAVTFQPYGVMTQRVPAVPGAVTTPAANPYPFDCLVTLSPNATTAGLTVQVIDAIGAYGTVVTLTGAAPIAVLVKRRGSIQFGAGTLGTITWTWRRV